MTNLVIGIRRPNGTISVYTDVAGEEGNAKTEQYLRVWDKGGVIIGVSGEACLREFLDKVKLEDPLKAIEEKGMLTWVAQVLITEILKTSSKLGFPPRKELPGQLIVAVGNEMCVVQKNMEVLLLPQKVMFAAVGTGYQLALGVLEALFDENVAAAIPFNTDIVVKKAYNTARRYSNYIGETVVNCTSAHMHK